MTRTGTKLATLSSRDLLICSGRTRADALRSMQEALEGIEIEGVRTNLAFLRWLVGHPEFEAGNVSVVGVAIYVEDRYLPQNGLRVALDQIARLYAETAASERLMICKSYGEIQAARETGKIAFLITMEGIEPLGTDLNQLRVFYELGVRAIGLTHARTNAAAHGGVFAASGSPAEGLTPFGREVVRECEALGGGGLARLYSRYSRDSILYRPGHVLVHYLG